MPPEYSNETALELALKLAPLYGLEPRQLPTTVFADVLNGLAECDAILARLPQQDTPAPATQYVPERLP